MPALLGQWRHRGRLQAGRYRARLIDDGIADVIVHHHVVSSDQHAVQPPLELRKSGRGRRGLPANKDRLRLQDGFTEELKPGLAERATRIAVSTAPSRAISRVLTPCCSK